MLTEDEQLQQAFARGKQALSNKQDDDAAMRAAYEKYHPSAGEGAAINEGSAKRSISPGAAIGSLVGGAAGGLLTAPSGGLGAIPGAVAGAAIGELAQQGYDRMTNSAYAPHSLEESAKRVGAEAAYSAAGEVGGALGARAVKTVTGAMGLTNAVTFTKPVSYAQPRELTPEQLQTKAFLDQHQIPYTPEQITGSTFHSFARSVADNGTFSEKDMRVFTGQQDAAVRASVVSLADTFGTKVPPDVLGQQILRTIRNEDDTITSMVIDPLYNRIANDLKYTTQTIQVPTGRMVPHSSGAMGPNGPMMIPEMTDQLVTQGGLLVDQTPVKALFKDAVREIENTATLQNRPDLLKAPNYQSMKRFLDMPDLGQWADAHTVLKETRRNLREMDNPTNIATGVLQDEAVLTRAEKVLETQLEAALQNSPNAAHQADLALWEQAQSAVKSKNERLRNDVTLRFIKAIDEHGGEAGLKPFVNSMTPDDAWKVMEAVKSDPVVQGSLRRQYLEDKIIKAGGMADAEAPFDAEKFRKALFGKDEMNARKSAVMLDPVQQSKLKEFTDAVSTIQAQGDTSGKFGSVFIKMTSAGALFSIPYSAYQTAQGDSAGKYELGAAASILIGPKALAYLLTNPKTAEYMIQGLRYSATSNQAVRVTRELMRLDQGFANAVRTGISAYHAEQTSGPIHRTAETVQKGMAETTQSIFGQQQ